MTKIKILFAVNCMNIGGAPSVVYNQIKYLDREKFDPYLLTLYPSKPANFLSQMDFLPKDHQMHFHLKRRSIFDVSTLYAIYRYLKEERFDVVYTHLFLANFLVRSIAVLARVPTIIIFEHSTYFNKSPWQVAMDRLLARFTSRILVSTEEVRRFTMEQERLPESLFSVVRNPVSIPEKETVNINDLKSLAEVLPSASPIFVTIGRFSQEKGQHVLIEAIASLRGKLKHAEFVLVGHGPKESELKNAVLHHGIERIVHVIHAPERAKEFLHIADWFILPSLREGQAIVVEEAMLAGLPVIAAKLEGTGNIVKDTETGLLFPVGDPQALASRIDEVVRQEAKILERYAQNVKTYADGFLSAQQRVRAFEEIIIKTRNK